MEQFYQNNIAIVGAGPSGFFCALNILDNFKNSNFSDFSLTIFDKAQILRTILPTGNGRCNLTNSISDIKEFASNYPRGEKFLYSIFSKHFNYDSIEFFNKIGIDTYIQDDNRVFPKSNSSKDVRDKMFNFLKKFKNYKIIQKNVLSKNDLKNFNYIIIACGSRGSENLIKNFNHSITPFKKALCELIIDDERNFPQGVSVKSLDGDFIFTKKGVSGPLIFKISSINAYQNFPYEIEINLFDFEELKKIIKLNPKKSIGNLISKFIPRSLAFVLIENYNKNASEVSFEDIKKYSVLKLKIISTSQNGQIVNAGGVKLNEIDSNCKSKLYPNLWFCGEILDIDGFCGGFNLQNCWSSAYVVAKNVVTNIIKNNT